MNRTILNFWLNSGLLVTYVALIWSSTVLHLVFPPGPDAAGWTLWGGDYLHWRGFQFGTLVVLTLGILVHVMLHWSWVCGVVATKIVRTRTRPDEGAQTLYGVGLLIVLIAIAGGAMAAARLSLQSPRRNTWDAASVEPSTAARWTPRASGHAASQLHVACQDESGAMPGDWRCAN